MPNFTYASRGRSFVGRTFLVIAIAGTGFVAGALFHNPASSRDASAPFASGVQAAQSSFRDASTTTGTVAPAVTGEWTRSDGERIAEPRECDLASGIATACLFMD